MSKWKLTSINSRLQATCNIAKVLSLGVGLEVVKLLLGLSLSFDGVVGVVDRAGNGLSVLNYSGNAQSTSQTYPLRPAATCVGSL